MAFDYDSWITQAKERLDLLYEQRDAISNEISALEKGIEGFLPLTHSAWIGPTAGITDAIRKVLAGDPKRLFSPVEIRDTLLTQGVNLTQKNSMATIHQVLSRLVDKEDVRIQMVSGKNRYRWTANRLTPVPRSGSLSAVARQRGRGIARERFNEGTK